VKTYPAFNREGREVRVTVPGSDPAPTSPAAASHLPCPVAGCQGDQRRWLVVYDREVAEVSANEHAARVQQQHGREVAPDVEVLAMPLELALAAPQLLEALEAASRTRQQLEWRAENQARINDRARTRTVESIEVSRRNRDEADLELGRIAQLTAAALKAVRS
jgi:hypothetical protein